MNRWFQRVVLRRRWLCFLVFVLAFFAFGAASLNLFLLLRANTGLLLDHGWQAVLDGGGQQFAELLASGCLSAVAWLVFKACEHRLVHWLNEE